MIGAAFRLVFLNVLGNVLRIVGGLLRLPRILRRPRWVRIRLEAPLPARPPRHGRFLFRRPGPSVAGLRRFVEELAQDRRLLGVVVEVHSLSGGWARIQSLRAALAHLRTAGKRVVVHLSSPGVRELYLACAGDAILADESGPLRFTGIAAEVRFFGEALARVGARAEAESRGAYKSFAEIFTRSDMSPAHREALDAILDRVEAELVSALAGARRLAPERARELLRGGPYTAPEAERLGLIDAVRYRDEVCEWLEPERKGGARIASPAEWARARPPRLVWRPLVGGGRRVRVLSLSGGIVDGEGREFPTRTIGADAAARALKAARRDRKVAAVVLHVNSRGGSASASDRIWREVVRLDRDKPVIAYFDDVAASGGYYLACGARRIVAQPGTLTGSIGVVGGKLSFEKLFDRIGVHTEILSRGDRAAMHTPSRGYTEEQRRSLAAEIDALYEQFTRKVREGRKLSAEATEAAAQGRVWTGVDALERGLVDELGDVERAIEAARELARRFPGEKLEVEDAHVAPRRQGLISRILGGTSRGGGPRAAGAVVAALGAAGSDGALAEFALDVEILATGRPAFLSPLVLWG